MECIKMIPKAVIDALRVCDDDDVALCVWDVLNYAEDGTEPETPGSGFILAKALIDEANHDEGT